MKGALILLLGWATSVSMSKCSRDQQRERYAVEGEAAVLRCYTEAVSENLTFRWTKDNHTVISSPRVKFQGSSLWFLSTVSSDSGQYQCFSTETTQSEKLEARVLLSVEKEPCPRALTHVQITEGDDINMTCTEDPIETLGEILQVQWWKDCESTGKQGSEISLHVSLSSSGNYTCKVIFRYEGKNYTVSYTSQLSVQKTEPVVMPKVMNPRNDTLHIKPGVKTELECTVFIGSGEEALEETLVYWTVNGSFIEEYPQLQENFTYEKRRDNQFFGKSKLFISEAIASFFDIPFECNILNSVGTDKGLVWLRQGDQSPTLIQSIIAVALIIVTLAAIVLFVFFKIDIIISCRHLCSKGRGAAQGSRIYNAYVCSCHYNSPGSSRAQDLALRIIPEVLEQQHDLRLFIHGRDDVSTEVNVADMTDAVGQSRTVLLVLPGSGPASHNEEESEIPLNAGKDELNATHCRDLYPVIAQSSVPVIVVESGENADYSLLPESVQSIIERKRVLRWNPAMQPRDRFWKHLQYHMT
ncbi:hypothetical protein NFI96_028331 [Prochilodus magdalenae]|nr:hypothetical protein NFI96_028331 [Prochilodus magdalenae]